MYLNFLLLVMLSQKIEQSHVNPFRSVGLTLLWHWSNQQITYRAANWLACIFIDWLTDVLQSGRLTHDIFLINLVSNEVEAL